MVSDKKTINEELEALGIESSDFDTFYESLKGNKVLPPEDIVPEDKYQPIVDYLTGRNIIGSDGKVNENNLDFFDALKGLEKRLSDHSTLDDDYFSLDDIRPTGGFSPCRRYSSFSTGGFTPCR